MTHFAEIDENGIVLRVIVAEQDFIDSGKIGDPKNWIQTSNNTRKGIHVLGGIPLRENFASVGYTYDKINDVFRSPSPYPSWILKDNIEWISPIDNPKVDEQLYIWNEQDQIWQVRKNV